MNDRTIRRSGQAIALVVTALALAGFVRQRPAAPTGAPLRPELRDIDGQRCGIVSPSSFPCRVDTPAGIPLVVMLNGARGTVALSNQSEARRADGTRVRYIADARSGGKPAVPVPSSGKARLARPSVFA